MGLIKDSIGAALGANQVNNGFNGPKLPFQGNKSFHSSTNDRGRPAYSMRQSPRSSRDRREYMEPQMDGYPHRDNDVYDTTHVYTEKDNSQYNNQYHDPDYFPPPSYEQRDYGYTTRSGQSQNIFPDRMAANYNSNDGMRSTQHQDFRPLALPQIQYGDGQPFLRGYSEELAQYGVNERDFLTALDSINVAIIPNPENQIFQKAANIAGWFLPGAAGLGLMAGQFGVGIGSAFGHQSLVGRNLSRANLELFVPKGLEICIGKTKDINQEVGFGSTNGPSFNNDEMMPEDRIAAYGDRLAQLTLVLPPELNTGRQDPLAKIGKGLGDMANNKSRTKAKKDMGKGKDKKFQELESGLKWLFVRRATPDALSHWQQTLDQSNTALQQEQAAASTQNRQSYRH